MTATAPRRWATVDAAGQVLAVYGRRASAELNVGGGMVAAAPLDDGADPNAVRWTGEAWAARETPADPLATIRAGRGRSQRRALAYGAAIETGEQFEVLTEVLLAMEAAGLLAGLLSPTTAARLTALKDKIAAVKADNP